MDNIDIDMIMDFNELHSVDSAIWELTKEERDAHFREHEIGR